MCQVSTVLLDTQSSQPLCVPSSREVHPILELRVVTES